MNGMGRVIDCLSRLTGANVNGLTDLIAEVKASGLDEASQTEIINVANKAISAETKRNADINALLAKYNIADNIDPAEPNDDEEYY